MVGYSRGLVISRDAAPAVAPSQPRDQEGNERMPYCVLWRPGPPAVNLSSALHTFIRPSVLSSVCSSGEYPTTPRLEHSIQ